MLVINCSKEIFYCVLIITKTRLFKYTEKIYHQIMAIFQIKISDIFHISAQNIDRGYSLTKIMYTPVNPSFTI